MSVNKARHMSTYMSAHLFIHMAAGILACIRGLFLSVHIEDHHLSATWYAHARVRTYTPARPHARVGDKMEWGALLERRAGRGLKRLSELGGLGRVLSMGGRKKDDSLLRSHQQSGRSWADSNTDEDPCEQPSRPESALA